MMSHNFYLCGNVTGLNRRSVTSKFKKAEERLYLAWPDTRVYNPIKAIPKDISHEKAMLQCIHMLTKPLDEFGEFCVEPCRDIPFFDILVLLDEENWSVGMQVEIAVAKACGIKVIPLKKLLDE